MNFLTDKLQRYTLEGIEFVSMEELLDLDKYKIDLIWPISTHISAFCHKRKTQAIPIPIKLQIH